MSLRGGAQLGGRKREFIRADTANYSCSTSSRLTRDATSTFWKVPLPSLNPRFIEDLATSCGEKEKEFFSNLLERRYAEATRRCPAPTASIKMPERQRLPTKYSS